MVTSNYRKIFVISGLVLALTAPGLASADSRTKHSLKYQARERMEHHDRRDHREHREYRHDDRRFADRHHGHRQHYGHHESRHNRYWDHRRHGHHDARHYRHYGHHHGRHYGHYSPYYRGIHLSGVYLTPHLGLQIHLGH